MGKLGEAFANMNPDSKQAMATGMAKLGVGIFNMFQQGKTKERQEKYLGDIRTLEANRQSITNPYANLENPYKNLSVATGAAKMQAEEADIALANTLDTLRATGKGAGGATALAQAALKSKQQISANIEQQEVNNEKLKAQGQLQVDIAKGKGEYIRASMQEERDVAKLDRLQGMADNEAALRAQQYASGIQGIAGGLGGGIASLINPSIDDGTGRNKRKKSTPYDLGVNDNNSDLTDNNSTNIDLLDIDGNGILDKDE